MAPPPSRSRHVTRAAYALAGTAVVATADNRRVVRFEPRERA